MSLAVAANPDEQARVPAPFLTIEQAAPLMGVSYRRARQRCEEWSAGGLARKFDGVWGIHPRADQRLHNDVDRAKRDREQIAELTKAGVRQAAIDVAVAKRDILRGLADFECDARTERENRERYVAHLKATRVVPCDGIKRISVSTFYRWKSEYNDGIRGLVRKSTASDRDDISGEASLDYAFNLVHCGNGISLKAALTIARGEALKHRGDPAWRLGSYSAVRQAIKTRSPQILKVLAAKGERSAKAACIPKGHRDFESIPSGVEWVGDERTVDVMCRVLTARGWKATRQVYITAWTDMRSRRVVGWIIETFADSNTILGSLKIGIAKHGQPALLRVDWGHDYKKATGSPHSKRWKVRSFDGPRIGSILDELGIEASPVMPYTPWSKPIESFFKTMKEHWDKLNASFWGGCPSERHEDRQRWVNRNIEKLPTVDDIRRSFTAFVDVYHRTPHTAVDMFGKSPLEAMEAFRDDPASMESETVLDHLFCEFVQKLVRRDGVRHNSRWYGLGDSRVVALQGQKVLLAIQPDDASRATVCRLDRTPLFVVECEALRGFTQRDAADIGKRQARLLRPYRQQARDARRVLLNTQPTDLLANFAAGVEAEHGRRVPDEVTPPTFTIRPALEEALATAGPAPSEQRSIAVRTGTDDEITVDDMLAGGDDMPPWESAAVDDDTDFFGLDDIGE
ncbi:MAG: hypothetical protein ABII12_03280 [Planctomycetota bacterium]